MNQLNKPKVPDWWRHFWEAHLRLLSASLDFAVHCHLLDFLTVPAVSFWTVFFVGLFLCYKALCYPCFSPLNIHVLKLSLLCLRLGPCYQSKHTFIELHPPPSPTLRSCWGSGTEHTRFLGCFMLAYVLCIWCAYWNLFRSIKVIDIVCHCRHLVIGEESMRHFSL